MTTTKLWVMQGTAIAIVFAFAMPAHAVKVTFTVDQIGSQDPTLVPIAPTAANIGQYNAGSFLTVTGGASGTFSGLGLTGSFSAQKAASGAWSTGNPGSLTSFYTGTVAVEFDSFAFNNISFLSEGNITANNYIGAYPVKGGPAVSLSPAIGGGFSTTTPGSAAADYGVSVRVIAAIGNAAQGTAALRDAVMGVVQNPGVPSQVLSAPVAGVQTFSVKNNIASVNTSGTFDYNLKGNVVLGNTVPNFIGTQPLSSAIAPNTSDQLGSLKTIIIDQKRGLYEFWLTVPITSTTTQDLTGSVPVTLTVTTTGQIAAHVLYQAPEPSSLVLAGCAAIPLGLMAWRRRRRG